MSSLPSWVFYTENQREVPIVGELFVVEKVEPNMTESETGETVTLVTLVKLYDNRRATIHPFPSNKLRVRVEAE